MSTVYLNGEFMPIEEARVPVMDRGFLFGDGVYEVIPVYSRRPFRLAEHLRRLATSLAAIRLASPHADAEWTRIIEHVVAAAVGEIGEDQSVYLQVTRGPMAVRNHAFPKEVAPTVFVMTEPLVTPSAELRETGIAAVSAADNRWHRCDIKSISLLANCLLRQRAVDHGCAETVLFRDGFLIEGAASNIFAVKDGALLAPQKNHLMLPGITYDVVLELAARHGLPVQVRDVLADEARNADELWLTSSTKEVLPIVMLDDRKVGAGETALTGSLRGSPRGMGTPGPVFRRMHGWYQEFKRREMRGG